MSKGENIFQRKDGRREARHSKGYELPAVPPVRQLLRRVAARKADGGVRRENARKRRCFPPAPDVFLQRGEIRDMRRARNGQVFRGLALGGTELRPYGVDPVILRGQGFPVYIRRGDPAPIGVRLVLLYGAEQSPAPTGWFGCPVETGIPRLYPAGRSHARRGAFGVPVGAGLCSAPFYPRVSGLPSSSAAVSSSPR